MARIEQIIAGARDLALASLGMTSGPGAALVADMVTCLAQWSVGGVVLCLSEGPNRSWQTGCMTRNRTARSGGRLEALRSALITGEQSGEPEEFSFEEFLETKSE